MKKITLLFFASALYCGKMNAQTSITFKPGPAIGEDASISTNVALSCNGWENTPNPNATEFNINTWTYGGQGCDTGTVRGLLRFSELATIPTTAIITNATLRLYTPSTSTSYGNSFYQNSPHPNSNQTLIKRVTQSWNEATVTWSTMPTTTTTNQILTPNSTVQWNWIFQDNSTDLRDIVQFMVSNPSQNFGFMLQQNTETARRAMLFASSDHANAALWPELEVTYTTEDTCNTNFSYTFTTEMPNQVSFQAALPNGTDYEWIIAGANSLGPGAVYTFSGAGSYDVCLEQNISAQKCPVTCVKVCIDGGLGVKGNNFLQGFSTNIAPNPTKNKWNISVNAPQSADAVIELIDVSGKRIVVEDFRLKAGTNTAAIDVTPFASGIYFMKISTKQGGGIISNNKLVKD